MGHRIADPPDLRAGAVWEAFHDELRRSAQKGRLRVVDVGGGTGGLAVRVAALGHAVTVIDPSPDALAASERRAAEAGVTELVTEVQGDLTSLTDLVEPESVDAVVCHGVLELVDEPVGGCRAVAAVLRPGGLASVVAANRTAAVLAQAITGHFAAARAALAEVTGAAVPSGAATHRFTEPELTRMLAEAGMRVVAVQGVRLLADLLPGALADPDPQAAAELAALEAELARRPEFRAIASRLHVLARR